MRQADVGLPRPDVVLFFEVSPEVVKLRGGYGDERLESDELQGKVHSAMKLLKKDYWQVSSGGESEGISREQCFSDRGC